jgi:hypothetical protein
MAKKKGSKKGGSHRRYPKRRGHSNKPKRISATHVLVAAKLLQGEVAMADRAISKVEAVTGYGLDALLLGDAALLIAGAISPSVARAHAKVLSKIGLRR